MGNPPLPRSSRRARLLCSLLPAAVIACVVAAPALADNPSGSGAATPASVPFNTATLLTVTVTPATSPASTGLAVTADLSSIGGSPVAALFDDGSNGDVTAGDNVFSLSFTPLAIPGTKTLPITVTDARGNGAGWALTLTASARTAAGKRVEGLSTAIWSVELRCATCTRPRTAVTFPARLSETRAMRAFAARRGTGMGKMRLTARIAITVPVKAPRGAYVLRPRLSQVAGP